MINGKKVFAVIMAAGKGTRIGATDRPKVMFEVAGKPIISWAIEPFLALKKQGLVDRIITIVGFRGNQVIDYLGEKSEFVWQKEQLGTGHAVMQTEKLLADEDGYSLIVNGDHALYTPGTFEKMVRFTAENDLTLGFAVVKTTKRFDSYGRVVRDEEGKILSVVEVPEATEKQFKIAERSPSIFVAENKWLFSALKRVPLSPVKKEYYVNSIIEIAIKDGAGVDAIEIDDEDEALGINTHEDRAEVEEILKKRRKT